MAQRDRTEPRPIESDVRSPRGMLTWVSVMCMAAIRKRTATVVLLVPISLLLALLPVSATAPQKSSRPSRYKLIDLGTFGGPQSSVVVPEISYAQVLNNLGAVAGLADTPTPDPFPDFCFADCYVAHTFKARSGNTRDLGALPGGGSSQGNWISANGLIAGISENGEIDPLNPGFPQLRAVLWSEGKITDLGTLGGYESVATSVNSRGQVVGLATNTTPDPDSIAGGSVQTRAFLWEDGLMQDLGTLGTGTDAMALLVNERGQIAGDSYTGSDPSEPCAMIGLPLSTGAFLWDHGTLIDLGNLGGTCTYAFAMNNRGQVVGGSSLTGDQVQHPYLWDGRLIDLHTFGGSLGAALAINDGGAVAGWASYEGDGVLHAALWTQGVMKDLGTLNADEWSFAFSINARGQVVGVSGPPFDFDAGHAFLWEDGGPMVNLEDLVVGGSPLHLTEPGTINDRGEIAGNGFDAEGNEHAYLLVPCNDDQAGAEARNEPGPGTTPHATGSSARVASKRPNSPRQQPLLRRLGQGVRRGPGL
jgi:probable HAF family extracellular repeat protein